MYAVAWQDERDLNPEIYMIRLDVTGAFIGVDRRMTTDPYFSGNPSIASNGAENFLFWQDDRDLNNEIYLALVCSCGSKSTPDLRLTSDLSSSESPSMAWTGSEWAVAWHDYRDGAPEIYLALVDSTGTKTSHDVRITTASGFSEDVSLVWTGSELGAAWADSRHGDWEIYFTRIGFCD
jgi:hypothetical protein